MRALALAQNPEYHAPTKRINLQKHFVREKIQEELVSLEYLTTEDMAPDRLIKSLGKKCWKASTAYSRARLLTRSVVVRLTRFDPDRTQHAERSRTNRLGPLYNHALRS